MSYEPPATFNEARARMATAYLTKSDDTALARRDFEFFNLQRSIAKFLARLEGEPFTPEQVATLQSMLETETEGSR